MKYSWMILGWLVSQSMVCAVQAEGLVRVNADNEAEVEEFASPIYELDENGYLISKRSNLDGVCKMLTGDEASEAIASSFAAFSETAASTQDASGTQLAILDSSGEIKGFQKSAARLVGKARFIERIVCKTPSSK